MDPLHERLARVALRAAGRYGFALAGGYAVQAHGFLDRPSSDVDLFAAASAEFDFAGAVDAVVRAFEHDGLMVDIEVRSDSFARLNVTSGTDLAKVELGVDWRESEPVQLAIGPVLHPDDAVANKVCALFGRAEVRDYVDVDAILASRRYTRDELLTLAAHHDPGFDPLWFAEALAAVGRLPERLFEPYGLNPEAVAALKKRMIQWALAIRTHQSDIEKN
jgi:hypothetical protein